MLGAMLASLARPIVGETPGLRLENPDEIDVDGLGGILARKQAVLEESAPVLLGQK